MHYSIPDSWVIVCNNRHWSFGIFLYSQIVGYCAIASSILFGGLLVGSLVVCRQMALNLEDAWLAFNPVGGWLLA